MNVSNSTRFGVFDDFIPCIGRVKTTCIFPIDAHQFIATTNKGFFRFENNEIKEFYSYKCITSAFIEEINVVVGITQNTGFLIAFMVYGDNPKNPILAPYDTKHSGVIHMIYSRKSHAVLTIGQGVSVWNLTSTKWNLLRTSVPPVMSVSPRCTFASEYAASIMNPPIFDYDEELLILPTERGLIPFDLDGNQHKPISLFPSSLTSSGIYAQVRTCVYSIWKEKAKNSQQKAKKLLLTSDPENGLCLWNGKGKLKKRINTVNTCILMLNCIDGENAVYMDSRGTIFLLNIKTEKAVPCYVLPKVPLRVFYMDTYIKKQIAVCSDLSMDILRINIPWSTWKTGIEAPKAIIRCPLSYNAARIIVLTSNSFIKILSPKDGTQLISATPKSSSSPINVLYDRGYVTNDVSVNQGSEYKHELIKTGSDEKRDQIFTALANETLICFETGSAVSDEAFQIDAQSRFITIAMCGEKWYYAIASPLSDFFLYDYDTLKITKRCNVKKGEIKGFFFHWRTKLFVVLFENEIILFDPVNNSIVSRAEIAASDINAIHGDDVFLGTKTGYLNIAKIKGNSIVYAKDQNQRPHMSSITGFSFGEHFWVTSSLDCTVKVWDYHYLAITTIELPLPLYSCCILNGHRDIIVGTDTAIMKIDGALIFDEFDDEDQATDNYDKITDHLSISKIFSPQPEEEEERKELFLDQIRNKVKRLKSTFDAFVQSTTSILQQEKQEAGEIDDEERMKILNEMTSITDAKETINQQILEPEEKKNEDEEKEKNDESNEAQETQNEPNEKKHKKVRKELTSDEIIRLGESSSVKQKKKKKIRRKEEKQAAEEESEDDDIAMDLFDEKMDPIVERVQRKKYNFDYNVPNTIHEEEIKKPSKRVKNKSNATAEKQIVKEPQAEKAKSPRRKPSKTKSNQTNYKAVNKEEKIVIRDAPKTTKNRKASTKKKSRTKESGQKEPISLKIQDKKASDNSFEESASYEEDSDNYSTNNENNAEIAKEIADREASINVNEEAQKPKRIEVQTNTDSTEKANNDKKMKVKPPLLEIPSNKSRRVHESPKTAQTRSINNDFLISPRIRQPEKQAQKKTLDQIDKQMSYILGYNNAPSYIKNRAPTPPPIRWGNHLISRRLFDGEKKQKEATKRVFRFPPPNIVIDPLAVIIEFSKGFYELKPLVDYLLKEKTLQDKFEQSFNVSATLKQDSFDILSRVTTKSPQKTSTPLSLSAQNIKEKKNVESDMPCVYPLQSDSRLLYRIPAEVSLNTSSINAILNGDIKFDNTIAKERLKPRPNFVGNRYIPFWFKVIDKLEETNDITPLGAEIRELLKIQRRKYESYPPQDISNIVPSATVDFIKANGTKEVRKIMEQRGKLHVYDFSKAITDKDLKNQTKTKKVLKQPIKIKEVNDKVDPFPSKLPMRLPTISASQFTQTLPMYRRKSYSYKSITRNEFEAAIKITSLLGKRK